MAKFASSWVAPLAALTASCGFFAWWHQETKKTCSLMRHVLLQVSMNPELKSELGLPLEWAKVWGKVHVWNAAEGPQRVGGILVGASGARAEVDVVAERRGFDWHLEGLEVKKL